MSTEISTHRETYTGAALALRVGERNSVPSLDEDSADMRPLMIQELVDADVVNTTKLKSFFDRYKTILDVFYFLFNF